MQKMPAWTTGPFAGIHPTAASILRDNFTWPAVAGRYLDAYPKPRLSPAGVPAVADVA